jgi:hypothetical protein
MSLGMFIRNFGRRDFSWALTGERRKREKEMRRASGTSTVVHTSLRFLDRRIRKPIQIHEEDHTSTTEAVPARSWLDEEDQSQLDIRL